MTTMGKQLLANFLRMAAASREAQP